MRIRQNDRLANLPPEDQAKLNVWLTSHPYRTIIQLAAAPRPDGLAFKTGLRALSRYYNKYLRPDPAAKMDQQIDLDGFSLLLKYRRQLVQEKRQNRLQPA